MSSGCLDYTEPSLSTALQGKQGVQQSEPPRTFSNFIIAEVARCVEFFHMSWGWFDYTELSLTTALQGKQSVQGPIYCVYNTLLSEFFALSAWLLRVL